MHSTSFPSSNFIIFVIDFIILTKECKVKLDFSPKKMYIADFFINYNPNSSHRLFLILTDQQV